MFGLEIFILSLLAIGGVTSEATATKKCYEVSTISSIGACDFSGICSVALSNGSFSKVKYPISGAEVCYVESKEYWWDKKDRVYGSAPREIHLK